jgi:sialic acid synthase SpsE
MKTRIAIDGNIIGYGEPVYIVAEIGSNHNNDFQTAKDLMEAAKEAGVQAIKFQTFKAKNHYSKYTPGFTYLENQEMGQSTYEMIHSLELDRKWQAGLMEYASRCGITFFSSPCDVEAINELAELGVAAFKVASFDITDIFLIKHMAKCGKPLILSTGMCNNEDIQGAIEASLSQNNDQVILLQCTSLYPAPPHLANLNAMENLRKTFGCPTGYSDHTLGEHVALAAVAFGASIIEKHFTLSRLQTGPDHIFAMEPKELKEMVKKIREIESAMGDGLKRGPRLEEMEMYEKGRRSLHARRELCDGDIVSYDDIFVKRPGYGISPRFWEKVIGMRVKRRIPEDYWITWEDIE